MGPRDRFLARLESELGSGAETALLISEARAHLDDSIRARLELGDSPEQAEREALRAFGSARAVGREATPKGPLVDRGFLFASLLVVGYGFVFGGGRSFPDWAAVFVVGLALLAFGAFLVASYRARRPQLVTFVAIFGSLWLFYAVPAASDDAAFVRENLAGGFARNRAMGRVIGHKQRSLTEGFARFAAGGGTASPSRVPTYEADGSLRLFDRPDRASAAAKWREALVNGPRNVALDRKELAESDARQQELAIRSYAGFLLRRMGAIFASTGWGPASAFLGVHLYAWLMGVAVRGRRRKARTPLA